MLTIDLSGQVALVLGGSRGIGASITEKLCQAGAATIFTHTGNPEYKNRIQDFVTRIKDSEGKVEAFAVNALDSHETTKLTNRIVQEYGKIDILVPNVGQNQAEQVEETTDEKWRYFIDINLSSAFYGVRAVLPHMIKMGRGRIIIIGSSAIYDGGGGAIDYAAAKSGLTGMMNFLVKNYGPKGILTNIIDPCLIETDLLRKRYPDEAAMAKLRAQTLVGRVGKPEDISGLVVFLASQWGDFICGQSILVDGGRTFFRQ